MRLEKLKYLYKNKYLSLLETSHGFVFAQRRNINSTASLCFKKINNKIWFLMRYQPLPLINCKFSNNWDDKFACPITGSLEENQTPIENAIMEIYEEANIIVTKEQLFASNFCAATTQMNEIVFNFVFDVTNCKVVNKKTGDGSFFENQSENKWIDLKHLQTIIKNQNNQIYLSSLVSCFNLFNTKYGKIKK